ncbi:GGDEF domain-containing protein [Haloimpatiens sp. FM7330]|uniref:GGDEF domain-containing protein n=1 Tax=Haloimpatiens sp. FM7330 TaxID=3298610 RepID=UPI0036450029
MNKVARNIDLYLILLFMDIFCVSSFLYMNLKKENIMDFVMLGVLFTVVLISYFRGIIFGLLISTFIIFSYATYMIYVSMFLGKTISTSIYMWMVTIPLSAFVSGRLSLSINSLQKINYDLQKEYKELVTIDKTTGLSNIKLFYEYLDKEISKTKRYKNTLSLMVIYIQYYEELNNILGKNKMKEILKEVSKCVKFFTRNEDERYVLSKDRIAIIMPNTDVKGAELVKGRIKNSIKDINLKVKEEDKNINLDVKIGVLQYNSNINGAFEFKQLVEKELEYDV